MAENPTLLAMGDAEPVTRRGLGSLRQVPLVRADAADSGDEGAGPASTYVGCVVDGRYRIEGVLGRGGMGVVYRARHDVIDKLFAVKILLPTEDGDVVERFVNEARAATAIGNAHIVDTVDFGELPDGSTYFVMEYLEGQTLARRIKNDGFVLVPRSLAIAKQIAEGMNAAHKAGIVHRDLKPENIFLTTRDGTEDFVKLLDFGIAKMGSAANRITRAGTIFGTPHYMSPEQASGEEVDARADIYSLGVIFYEMLSGKVPFDAENPVGLLTQHMYTAPVPLARLDAPPQSVGNALDAIVLKCLQKKPEDRYASMNDFCADVERFERGDPPVALADLLARAERDQDASLILAARRELTAHVVRPAPLWPWVLAIAAVLSAGGLFLTSSHRSSMAASDSVLVPSTAPAPTSSAATPATRSVALVFSPIDAEVYRDGKSLGGMPVSLAIGDGETVRIEIKRDGFYPETVKVDGSRPVVVVRLNAIPGVQPRVPVPKTLPLEELRRAALDPAARAMIVPLASAAVVLAATEHRDAGTSHASRPTAVTGPAAVASATASTGPAPAPPTETAAPPPAPSATAEHAPAGAASGTPTAPAPTGSSAPPAPP